MKKWSGNGRTDPCWREAGYPWDFVSFLGPVPGLSGPQAVRRASGPVGSTGGCVHPVGARALAFTSFGETPDWLFSTSPSRSALGPALCPGAHPGAASMASQPTGFTWPERGSEGGWGSLASPAGWPVAVAAFPDACGPCPAATPPAAAAQSTFQEGLLCPRLQEGAAPHCWQPLGASPSLAGFSDPAHTSVTGPFIYYSLDCAVCSLLLPCLVFQAHHFPELSVGFCKMGAATR